MRYIDADVLKACVHEREKQCFTGGVGEAAFMVCEELIDEMPAFDIRKAAESAWNYAEQHPGEYALNCNNCGFCLNHITNPRNYRYCPDCGAKMENVGNIGVP
ncbi:MAG: hypothetical protein J6X53_00295 [Abditibacteriota bacterium]|nr:hypothetical protein [Abditibacteriota bacterium]